MYWLAVSERKQEWLPKAATVPGEPGTVGFREPVDGISQALGLLPSRALSSCEAVEYTSGSGGCREAFRGGEDFS